MPYTLDTNIIKIRDVFAMNSKTNAFVEYDAFPVIGNDGHIEWKTPLQFLSCISYLNTPVLELIETVPQCLSTLSTQFTKERDLMLISTVNGLGETYVSSSYLISKSVGLTLDHGYISSMSLYTCVKMLSKLDTITEYVGPMVIFLQAIGSNFPTSGYVSTVNAGGFHNYYSTIGFTGGLTNANVNTGNTGNTGIQSLNMDLGGFEILPSSKMKLDINANVSVTYTNPPQPESIVTTFSTFLYNGTSPIGTPVVVNYSNLTFNMSKFTYFLTAADLASSASSPIGLWHSITNFDNTNARITVVPTGVYASLINMD